MVLLVPNRKDREMKSCTFPLVYLYSSNAVICVTAIDVDFSKASSHQLTFFHIHIFFIAPRMSKSTMPSFLEFGQEMTEYGEYWQLYSPLYLSRAIVDFFLFVWRRMKPVDEDINYMATNMATICCLDASDICCEDCIHEQLRCYGL